MTIHLSIIILIVLALFSLKTNDTSILLTLERVSYTSHLIFIFKKVSVFRIINYWKVFRLLKSIFTIEILHTMI